jgi:protein-tyrosine phosphatase
MIDIHSHILPGIDDGAKSLDIALDMLKKAADARTTAIIATPHYYRGRYEVPYNEVLGYVDTLTTVMRSSGIDLEIYPGQEILLDRHTVQLFRKGIVRGLNDSRYVLVELPPDHYQDTFVDFMYELRILGAVPILAHPERYTYIQDDITILNDFISEGCLFQINAGSLTGSQGKELEKTAKKLVQNGVCNFIASDAHNISRRSTGLEEGLEAVRKTDKSVVLEVMENARKVVMDEEIAMNRRIGTKKTMFNFFW